VAALDQESRHHHQLLADLATTVPQPERLGHDAATCSTCEAVAALNRRRVQREIAGLKAGLRIIDLRGGQ
jgi:hypothetical protein